MFHSGEYISLDAQQPELGYLYRERIKTLKQSLLSYYGDCIAIYAGKGTLTLLDSRTVQCSFEVGQLRKGRVILICDFSTSPPYLSIPSAQSFEGVTDEGLRIFTAGQIVGMNDLTNDAIDFSHIRSAFFVSEITIQVNTSKPVKRVRFGVTNLVLDKPLSLCLQDTSSTTLLSIEPIDGYTQIMRRVQTLRGIEITGEVSIDISEREEAKALEDVLNNLCYLLSVAQGTKIQWIYSYQYDETGALLLKQHDSNVTKVCDPLSLIEGVRETKEFLEGRYNSYVTNRERYRLAQGLIDAYMDAKAEADYLQTRGIKLAVVMEMLKVVFLNVPGIVQGGDLILTKQTFHVFQSLIENPLRYALSIIGVDESDQDEIWNKTEELNRKSFKPILKSIFKYIGLDIPKGDLDLFVACRNSLVHTGRFFSETARQKDLKRYKVSFDNIGRDEYYFLVNVLDKVFLRLLGYSGRYIERRMQGKMLHEQILTL